MRIVFLYIEHIYRGIDVCNAVKVLTVFLEGDHGLTLKIRQAVYVHDAVNFNNELSRFDFSKTQSRESSIFFYNLLLNFHDIIHLTCLYEISNFVNELQITTVLFDILHLHEFDFDPIILPADLCFNNLDKYINYTDLTKSNEQIIFYEWLNKVRIYNNVYISFKLHLGSVACVVNANSINTLIKTLKNEINRQLSILCSINYVDNLEYLEIRTKDGLSNANSFYMGLMFKLCPDIMYDLLNVDQSSRSILATDNAKFVFYINKFIQNCIIDRHLIQGLINLLNIDNLHMSSVDANNLIKSAQESACSYLIELFPNLQNICKI